MNDPFKPLRHRFRTWRNIRRLKRETAYYREQFRLSGLAIPGGADIIAIVSKRFPRQLPRPKGALNILSIYHDYNWEAASLGPSLAAFGTVRHIDWRDPQLAGGRQPGENGWLETMNAGLIRTVQEWNAGQPFDAMFTYLSGEQLTPGCLVGLRSIGAPIVNLALNDKEGFVGRVRKGHAAGSRDICRHFDLCWTSTQDALEKYVVEGATPLYLPEGANPAVHRAYDEQKLYDVSFVGQCYGQRPEVISQLKAAGIRIEVFGPGWPNGPLPTEEMVRTWSRSRINLGFGGVADFKKTFCLKGRDFEVPMSGGLYLTEHHDELLPYYDIDREIVTYTDFDDLLVKIRRLLGNPAEAESIRKAGRDRALREHTWEMRFEKVFRLLGVIA